MGLPFGALETVGSFVMDCRSDEPGLGSGCCPGFGVFGSAPVSAGFEPGLLFAGAGSFSGAGYWGTGPVLESEGFEIGALFPGAGSFCGADC